MYKSTDLERFVKLNILPNLPKEYIAYKKGDAIRSKGNFVQALILWLSRGGWIHVEPTLYVVGANPADETLHQTVSLGVIAPRKWHYSPDITLNETFKETIFQELMTESPISFTSSLDSESIDMSLRWFGSNQKHWAADLFLAFFNMTRGAPTARTDLARAFKLFHQHSRLSTNKPLRDWEVLLQNRFNELEKRLDNSDCIALCRADSESHAKMLGLPPIVWPSEWPTSVPPWPHETTSSLVSKIGNVFRRKL